ncbi:MAG TPA: rod shape-determining protein [Bacteroidales bacterium]|nr:rod shape-determining protein [Bacteroidales bacterium]HPS15674.1 rod shape-determining protein [Bacteroidales bacterium]
MLFASIDIGSNAVRLYFANVFEIDGIPKAEKASLIRIPLRLGEDVFNTGSISEQRVYNLLKTMNAFKLLIDVYKPVDYIACATSAMREASNNKAIIESIRNASGIDVRVIDGIEEARILCASNNILIEKKYHVAMYIDVGGGSTEISVIKDGVLLASNSFQLGTIRILSAKAHAEEWENLKTWLDQFKNDFGKIYLIGSGGNINKLSKLYSTQPDSSLSYHHLKKGLKELSSLTLQERITDMGMRPDRADVIIPAAEIFIYIMKNTKTDYVFVPRIGLGDGLIYTVYKRYKERGNVNEEE